MPFPPEGYHRVAKELSARSMPVGEGRYRTITGRAYYSAYLATREALKHAHGLDDGYTPLHEALCTTLAGVKTDPEIRKLGDLLNALRLRRVHADYQLKKPLEEHVAEDAVEDAAEVLALLPTVTARLPRVSNRY